MEHAVKLPSPPVLPTEHVFHGFEPAPFCRAADPVQDSRRRSRGRDAVRLGPLDGLRARDVRLPLLPGLGVLEPLGFFPGRVDPSPQPAEHNLDLLLLLAPSLRCGVFRFFGRGRRAAAVGRPCCGDSRQKQRFDRGMREDRIKRQPKQAISG